MKCDLALVADHVLADPLGKFNIMGEFKYIRAPSVPFVLPHMALAGRWLGSAAEVRGKQPVLQIEIVDGDGSPIAPRSPSLPMKFMPVGPMAPSLVWSMAVINIDRLGFSKGGDHTVHFFVDGVSCGEVSFHVTVQPKIPGASP